MYDYKECLDYVEKTLMESGNNFSKRHPYRSRFNHTRRVLRWGERLSEGLDIDNDVLNMAIIFHDIGYSMERDGAHQEQSAMLFKEFAKEHKYDEEFINKVVRCIEHHSNKELLLEPDKCLLEQILVMEADLLDEEGAHQIAYDALATGFDGTKTYEGFFNMCKGVKENKRSNPMVTKKAIEYWNVKQKFYDLFVDMLEEDLEETKK